MKRREATERLAELREEILRHDHLYYVLNKPKISDARYDKLLKGDYDWAHLAYEIWPDRVKDKCKKDLSIAIAHGLEDIYEGDINKSTR